MANPEAEGLLAQHHIGDVTFVVEDGALQALSELARCRPAASTVWNIPACEA